VALAAVLHLTATFAHFQASKSITRDLFKNTGARDAASREVLQALAHSLQQERCSPSDGLVEVNDALQEARACIAQDSDVSSPGTSSAQAAIAISDAHTVEKLCRQKKFLEAALSKIIDNLKPLEQKGIVGIPTVQAIQARQIILCAVVFTMHNH
jgi:hypothetical protein